VASAGDAPFELERQLIMFSLHGEHYGLPIARVQEIIRYTPPRVTAAARGLVQGLINLRGRVVPVVDLSSRLGHVLEITDRTRILVIEVTNGVLGLIVEAVDGVVEVPVDRIEAIPGAASADALGDEIATIDDQLVMLLDADRALGRALPATKPVGAQTAAGAPARKTRHPPRPTGPPPARRRSAATPQVPRARRHARDTTDGEE
jgi:purine-binding chemotaxis protein CheW